MAKYSTFNDALVNNSITNNLNDTKLDIENPFSFLDFLSYTKILENSLENIELYRKYLNKWDNVSINKNQNETDLIKREFTNLFKTIILEYTNEEEKRYFNNINLNSEEDLTVAIPFFSKKIKEICQYYQTKRNSYKRDLNSINKKGSVKGVQSFIKNKLIDLIYGDEKDLNITKSLTLSSFIQNVEIEIEEGFNVNNDIFDKSAQQIESIPVEEYYEEEISEGKKPYNIDVQSSVVTRQNPVVGRLPRNPSQRSQEFKNAVKGLRRDFYDSTNTNSTFQQIEKETEEATVLLTTTPLPVTTPKPPVTTPEPIIVDFSQNFWDIRQIDSDYNDLVVVQDAHNSSYVTQNFIKWGDNTRLTSFTQRVTANHDYVYNIPGLIITDQIRNPGSPYYEPDYNPITGKIWSIREVNLNDPVFTNDRFGRPPFVYNLPIGATYNIIIQTSDSAPKSPELGDVWYQTLPNQTNKTGGPITIGIYTWYDKELGKGPGPRRKASYQWIGTDLRKITESQRKLIQTGKLIPQINTAIPAASPNVIASTTNYNQNINKTFFGITGYPENYNGENPSLIDGQLRNNVIGDIWIKVEDNAFLNYNEIPVGGLVQRIYVWDGNNWSVQTFVYKEENKKEEKFKEEILTPPEVVDTNYLPPGVSIPDFDRLINVFYLGTDIPNNPNNGRRYLYNDKSAERRFLVVGDIWSKRTFSSFAEFKALPVGEIQSYIYKWSGNKWIFTRSVVKKPPRQEGDFEREMEEFEKFVASLNQSNNSTLEILSNNQNLIPDIVTEQDLVVTLTDSNGIPLVNYITDVPANEINILYQNTRPNNPQVGDFWFIIETEVLYRYNGTDFVIYYALPEDDITSGGDNQILAPGVTTTTTTTTPEPPDNKFRYMEKNNKWF